jgi:hypothetical protein
MKRTWVAGLVCGVVGLMVGALVPAERAGAQAPAAGAARFQVSAWGAGNGIHGAYIIDQQSGEVYLSSQGNKPLLVGKVGK